MVLKTYLRFQERQSMGVVKSNGGSMYYSSDTKSVFTPALENVHLWGLKTGLLEYILEGKEKSLVSAMAMNDEHTLLAVGHVNGHIQVWDAVDMEEKQTFHGHRSAITCLCFDRECTRLISGANDTDVVVWDLVGEQGVCRLRGHTNAVTQVECFGFEGQYVMSSSKDGYIKIWNTEIQHCVQTLVGHEIEVWCFQFLLNGEYLVSGGKDACLLVWKKQPKDDKEIDFEYVKLGDVNRIHGTKKRYQGIHVGPYGKVLFCQTLSKGCDVYRIRDEKDMRRKERKRLKRAKEKAAKRASEGDAEPEEVTTERKATDLLEPLVPLRTETKMDFITLLAGKHINEIRILAGLANNQLEEFTASVANLPKIDFEKKRAVEINGHRSAPRCVCWAQNEDILASISSSEIKLWDLEEQNCVRNIECPDGINCMFGPSDRHLFAGTKTGKLQLFDVPSATLLETFDAHSGAVWALEMSPDKTSIVTAGADHEVKFWNLILKQNEHSTQLSLVQTRVLQLTDEVLSLKISPDGKYVACSLVDQTIRVFFLDSLKFSLSLYGHRLPALCMDISSDSHLLVSGSADKNVKIWGLDFGDLHKSLFAHNDSVTDVRFVPGTHYFFSAGRDGAIKYWDGDKFEKILTLEGHNEQIWGLRMNRGGQLLASVGQDHSVRIWEEINEQLVLEEEQQKELETMYDKELNRTNESKPSVIPGSGLTGPEESGRATTANLETRTAGEKITTAIEMATHERKRRREWEESELPEAKRPKFELNPELRGREPMEYLMWNLANIESIHLEEALMVLPFDYARTLLENLDRALDMPRHNLELIMRCLILLIKEYQAQISTSKDLRPLINSIRNKARSSVREYRDQIGFNVNALKFMKRNYDDSKDSGFFVDRKKT